MINRLLIRIKTAQLVYANLVGNNPRYLCEEELMASFESSYSLYNYLLSLIVRVTDYRSKQIEAGRNKYLPTQEERFPNTRFINNQLARILKENSTVMDFCEEHALLDDFESETTYRAIFEKIEQMPLYTAYMTQSATPTFQQDVALWKEILNTVIPNCEELDETLESKNIYWNDDLTTIIQFVVKTITRIQPEVDLVELLPLFRSEDDRRFAIDLFHHAIDEAGELMQLITNTATNWEGSRIATMEKVIMICALAEIRDIPSIPLKISLNEYIELAKHYGSADSAAFINGILDKIVSKWKADGCLFK